MLRTGLTDQEIIAEASRKQLVFAIDSERERMLRQLGAGTALVNYLRQQRLYAVPGILDADRVIVSAPRTPLPVAYQPATQQTTPLATPDFAARDHQVQNLKSQIDALDEQIRSIRTNPEHNPYWLAYYNQQSRDAYLKQLDQQRDDLRRQKWQLEGR